jgi:hypothetical protein
MAPMSEPVDAPQRWIPNDWLDEIIPPLRESPDAWIGQRADGTPVLIGCYDGPIGEDEEQGWGNPVDLRDGQEVAFTWCRELGGATVIVAADGTFTTDCDMPPEATWVWTAGFVEGGGETIAECVTECGLAEEPGPYDMGFSQWSDGDAVFVFDATTRRFLPKDRPA